MRNGSGGSSSSSSSSEPGILVIGAGVSGLTTAIVLAETGHPVAIHAREAPQQTTSAVAGAIWGPHLVGPDDRIPRWGSSTMTRLLELAGDPAAGVRLVTGIVADRAPDPLSAAPACAPSAPPSWTDGVGQLTACDRNRLPAGYASGWEFTAPVVSMRSYLAYLEHRFAVAGGQLRTGRGYSSLAEAASESAASVIVNCTGAGARALVPDPSVSSVRGQAVIVSNPGVTRFFVGDSEEPGALTYFFPHEQTVVLGGTKEPGNWSREPDPGTAARIIRECAAVEPRLRGATVLEHIAGLRPVRPGVRLEARVISRAVTVVHNYGHGGAGVTLSWGCAADAAGLAIAALR